MIYWSGFQFSSIHLLPMAATHSSSSNSDKNHNEILLRDENVQIFIQYINFFKILCYNLRCCSGFPVKYSFLKLFLPYFLSFGTVMLVIWNLALWCTFLSIFTCRKEQTNLRGMLKVTVFVLDFQGFAFKITGGTLLNKSGKKCLLRTFSCVFPHLYNFADTMCYCYISSAA